MPLTQRMARAGAILGVAWLVTRAVSAVPDEGDALAALFRNALVIELWLAVLALAVVALVGRPATTSLGLMKSRLPMAPIAVAIVGTISAGHALDALRSVLGFDEGAVMLELRGLLEAAPPRRQVEAFVALALAPALAEELFCRGLLQRSLTRRYGPATGITVASAVFAALHVEPVQATYAAALGVYLGLVAHWSDSIRPAIACHAANNALAVWFLVHASEVPWAPEVSVAVGGALALSCLFYLAHQQRAVPAHAPSTDGPSPRGNGPPGLQP